MLGSAQFKVYQQTLNRVMFAEMIGALVIANDPRRLSIVGTSEMHERWLASRKAQVVPHVPPRSAAQAPTAST
jgi:hypothetical protein